MRRIICIIFFICLAFNCYAQHTWHLQESIGRQHLGMVTFNDLILEKKHHEIYIGLGMLINNTRSDIKGHSSLSDGSGMAYTFFQSLAYKIGYRYNIGKTPHVQFYPYFEGVLQSTGMFSQYFFKYSVTQDYLVNSIDINPTTFLMLNGGLGTMIPLNNNLSLSIQGGIPLTYVIMDGEFLYQSLIEPIIWQVGLKIKLSK